MTFNEFQQKLAVLVPTDKDDATNEYVREIMSDRQMLREVRDDIIDDIATRILECSALGLDLEDIFQEILEIAEGGFIGCSPEELN